MQQVEIEMISAETAEARVASPRDAVSHHVIGPHFGDQEYAVAPTGDHAADQFLRSAVAVSINVIPSERPVRSASSSAASGRLPCARFAEPWPSAGTIVPSGNFTIGVAARADALDSATIVVPTEKNDEPSATQSPLNSRRFSNCLFILHSQRRSAAANRSSYLRGIWSFTPHRACTTCSQSRAVWDAPRFSGSRA